MKIRLVVGIVVLVTSGYLFWVYLLPVEIVAVHDGNTILVKHFPHLKSQKIAWWEANKNIIKTKYGVPNTIYSDGGYSVLIVDFGDGYRTEPHENLLFATDEVFCFDDIKTDSRCIYRIPLLSISFSQNTGFIFESY